MKHLLFLFLDGVGLGKNDPAINPFAKANLPALEELLDGRKLIAANAPYESQSAMLLALDANLGVPGLPQSATGQATLLNGKNVPSSIGVHYGPKPNQQVAEILTEGNLFKTLRQRGLKTGFLNAYPPAYFEAIGSGRRLYGAIALAAARAGVPLRTMEDLRNGEAISADFTGQALRERLKLPDTPVITNQEAGRNLALLAEKHHFSLFEYWLTDYAGHGQDLQAACSLLEAFDEVLGACIQAWDPEQGLILLTSDHGNLEDLSTRRHTFNPVPCLIIGKQELRRQFANGLKDLTDIAPAITNFFESEPQ